MEGKGDVKTEGTADRKMDWGMKNLEDSKLFNHPLPPSRKLVLSSTHFTDQETKAQRLSTLSKVTRGRK